MAGILFAVVAAARVGVVAIGADVSVAGEEQAALEARVRAIPGAELRILSGEGWVSSGEFPVPPLDAKLRKEADDILKTATDAYYDQRLAYAIERLGLLGATLDRGNFSGEDRVRLQLWRVTAYLGLGDTQQAEAEARTAIGISPDLKVDESEFRPSVQDVVDRVRAAGLKMVTLQVGGLPPGASVLVDSRTIPAPIRVAVGKHRVSVTAPGRRPLVRDVDLTSDTRITLSLPLALDPDFEVKLQAASWHEAPLTRDEVGAFAEFAARAGIDHLVIAATRAEPTPGARVLVLSFGSRESSASLVVPVAGSLPILSAWVDTRIRAAAASPVARGPVARPTATPRARPRPTPRDSDESSAPLAIRVRGGVDGSQRTRALSGANGGGVTFSFAGIAPSVAADLQTGSLFGEARLGWQNWDGSSAKVALPGGGGFATVHGGSTVAAGLAGGWRHAFGTGGEDAPAVRAGAVVSFESHSADDVADASGKLGLLTSYQRIAAGARVEAFLPIPAAPSLHPAFGAGLDLEPVGTWTESPSGTSGTSPKPGLGLAWRAGISIAPADRVAVGIRYAGAKRSVKFSGPAAAPLAPAIVDATIDESFQSFGLDARYQF